MTTTLTSGVVVGSISASDRLAREAARTLPDANTLAHEQTEDAIDRLYEDTENYPRFPLASLDALAGCHAPDELWLWLGRQGNGKSLAMQNWAHWLVEQRIPTLYIGTEQDAHVLRIKQACVIVGVNPKLMLKPTAEQKQSEFYQAKLAEVDDAVRWLNEPMQQQLLVLANTRYVNRDMLRKWIAGGYEKYGIQYVIIDHIDHMAHGEGRNAPQELKASVQLAKDLACEYHICVMAASQVKRAGDAFKNFTPPEADDAFGSSAKEQIADVMFSCWRPLRTDLPSKQLREMQTRAREGHVAGDVVYQPDTMGVRLLKDRLGDAPGKQAMLHVERGRLSELAERDRYKTTI